MQLEQEAPRFGLERAVSGTWGPACVGVRTVFRSAPAFLVIADDQIARYEVNLFPVVVHERLGGVYARRKAQVTRAKAALVLLVDRTRQNLLLDALRITRWHLPVLREIDGVKLLVLLGNGHCVLLLNPRSRDCVSRTRA